MTKQRAHFAALLEDPETPFGVAASPRDVRGFIIARLAPAPPVYDPGGTATSVDDFAVSDAGVLARKGTSPAEHGSIVGGRAWATQLVVVTAGADDPIRAALSTADLSLASEWWVGSIT